MTYSELKDKVDKFVDEFGFWFMNLAPFVMLLLLVGLVVMLLFAPHLVLVTR